MGHHNRFVPGDFAKKRRWRYLNRFPATILPKKKQHHGGFSFGQKVGHAQSCDPFGQRHGLRVLPGSKISRIITQLNSVE